MSGALLCAPWFVLLLRARARTISYVCAISSVGIARGTHTSSASIPCIRRSSIFVHSDMGADCAARVWALAGARISRARVGWRREKTARSDMDRHAISPDGSYVTHGAGGWLGCGRALALVHLGPATRKSPKFSFFMHRTKSCKKHLLWPAPRTAMPVRNPTALSVVCSTREGGPDTRWRGRRMSMVPRERRLPRILLFDARVVSFDYMRLFTKYSKIMLVYQ